MDCKRYSQEEIKSHFRNKKCLECDEGTLVYYGTTNDGWTYKYSCDNCQTRYEFTESDMGQTLPLLESNA